MSDLAASDELMELVFAALDHGIASVTEGGPLTPFFLADTAEGRRLERFAAQRLEEGLMYARAAAREADDARRLAIAYDGYLTVESERYDAIFVQAQERGERAALVFAQRYRPGGRFRKFATVGDAAYVGSEDPLF